MSFCLRHWKEVGGGTGRLRALALACTLLLVLHCTLQRFFGTPGLLCVTEYRTSKLNVHRDLRSSLLEIAAKLPGVGHVGRDSRCALVPLKG